MKKVELVEAVATNAGLTKADALRAIEATFDAITEALKKGEKLTLIGFGTFGVSKREGRTGRNPQTGAAIQIPARNAVTFKAGNQLKKAIFTRF